MKPYNFLIVFVLLFLFACEQNTDSDPKEDQTEILEENAEKEALKNVDKSSVKYKLLGMWEAIDDPTLRFELTALKYKKYDLSTQVWNLNWDLTSGADVDSSYIDDNGDRILVYDQEGNVFFITEIDSLSNNEIILFDLKGGREGKSRSYMKIK